MESGLKVLLLVAVILMVSATARAAEPAAARYVLSEGMIAAWIRRARQKISADQKLLVKVAYGDKCDGVQNCSREKYVVMIHERE